MGSDVPSRAWRFFWLVTKRPRLVLVTAALLILAIAPGAARLGQDARIEAFIPAEHPAMQVRSEVKEIFGLEDPIAIAVVRDGPDGVFTPHTLALIETLTRRVARAPGVDPERVTSLATVKDIASTPEGMRVERFFTEPPRSPAGARAVRAAVLRLPLYRGTLVAEDGSATWILAELLDDAEGPEAYAAILALVEAMDVSDGESIHVAGGGAVTATLGAYIDADSRRLNPFATLIISFVLLIAFRSLRGVLLPNLLILGTVVTTLGVMSLLGVALNVITNTLPVVLIALAVADGIHVLSQFHEEQGRTPRDSRRVIVVRAMVAIWRPCAITTVTDVVGFLAIFAASWMPPMRDLGLFGALGMTLALLLSLTALPAALAILPLPKKSFLAHRRLPGRDPESDIFGRRLEALGRVVLQQPGRVLLIAGLVSLFGVAGAFRLQVDDSRVANFHADEPVRRADGVMNERLAGTSFLDVFVEASDVDALLEPERLEQLEALEHFALGLPHVTAVSSIGDYLKQMNRVVDDDRSESHRLPASADAAAQYLLLYAAGGDQREIDKHIDDDYRRANLRLTLDTSLHSERNLVVEPMQRYLADHFDSPGLAARLAGPVWVDHHWVSEVGRFHFRSMALALLAVWVTLSLCFRSLTLGTLAVLPVGLSVLVIYAVMGFSGIWLGVGTSMFAAIAIGTGVDFAVHSMDRLLALRRAGGDLLTHGPRELFATTGRALLFSAACMVLGFAVLVTSRVPSLCWFGIIVATAVSTSFVASLTVLPAALRLTEARRSRAAVEIGSRSTGALVSGCVVVFALFGLIAVEPAGAKSWPAGEWVVAKVNAREEGESVARTLVMEMTNRRGRMRRRVTKSFRNLDGGERRTAIFFESPSNIRDTAFLTVEYLDSGREDDRWLYLPADRRVRRVSAANRGEYFLGTDFSYEDIKNDTRIRTEDYQLRTLGEGDLDGRHCYRVESIPANDRIAEELGYGRVVVWVDSEIWFPRRYEIWDIAGNPLKTVEFGEIRLVQGIWTAHRIEARHLRNQHTTVFHVSEVDYEADFGSEVFTERGLRRGPP